MSDNPLAAPPPLLPAPTPRKSGRVWFFLTLIVSLLLILSLFGNLVLALALGGDDAGAEVKGFSQSLVDGDKSEEDFIAIVPVQGMIMEPPSDNPGKGSLGAMVKLLKQLEKQEHLKGVLLVVDSPGGGVTASDRMYEELKHFKETKKVPVVAVFEDVAASGGYYVAMASDHILAHPTTITGSIGVISHFYNFTDLMGKVGVDVNTIKSLNWEGKESFKDIGSPYRKMKPEERKLMQELITEMWERFTSVVAEGRKGKLTLAEVRKLADGRVFSGGAALKAKLVDQVGYSRDAYAEIRKRCGNQKAKIVRYLPEKSWEDLFTAQALVPKVELPSSGVFYLWEAH
ncbi:signal peptide peptidase SppA [bacterium]|nr:signal peptide peptidase SppA [bacterium]